MVDNLEETPCLACMAKLREEGMVPLNALRATAALPKRRHVKDGDAGGVIMRDLVEIRVYYARRSPLDRELRLLVPIGV